MKSYFDTYEVRELLLKHYSQFYHFSVDTNLENIMSIGLSPSYEDEQSSYCGREYEPNKALRYCTEANISGGKSAAERYTQFFDHAACIWMPSGAKLIQITVSAQSLLDRLYGLDFSNGPQASEMLYEIASKGLISPEFFLKSLQKHGCISCYEDIPASEFLDIKVL